MSEESTQRSLSGEYPQNTAIGSDTESIFDKEVALDDLLEKRQLVNDLLSEKGRDGDMWYIIPAEFLNNVLNIPLVKFEDLKSQVGPLFCESIVDADGNLLQKNEESIESCNISPKLFNLLVEWFGITGNPVARTLIFNSETGENEIEKFPPIFYLHQLAKKQSQLNTSELSFVRLSRSKTFGDLHNAIRGYENSFKGRTFRIWFIESISSELPAYISLSQFLNEVGAKTLVHEGIWKESLVSQGIDQAAYHILIEQMDNSTNKFPVDTYLNNFDLSQLNIDEALQKGGNLGLQNLGNTCYMNSALQCLLHIPEINYYFLYNIYAKELNLDNPLGNHGHVANSFGSLLKQLFDNSSKNSSIAPREFKSTVGHYSSMFSGYHQQDSQEFLSWLLDALHEDLNRIYDKPYCEKPELKDEEVEDPNAITNLAETCWKQHKQRNDSVIIDLFTGLYQSTLVCPVCSKTSITFDPFNDLTLPLPMSKKWYHTFTIVDLSDNSKLDCPIKNLEVELNKNSNYDDLTKYLGNFLNTPLNELFLFEIFQNNFYTDFQSDYNRNKFLPISDIIRDSDEIVVYIIPHNPETDIIVPVLNAVDDSDKSYQIKELFAIPIFIVLNKETEIRSFGMIRKKLEAKLKVLIDPTLLEDYQKLMMVDKIFDSKDFPLLRQEIENTINNEDEMYDSDVSIANPHVSADSAFEVKYYNDNIKVNYRHANNSYVLNNLKNSGEESNSILSVPLHKPNFSDFKPLVDQLPSLKKNYYHYPEYERKVNQDAEVRTSTESEEIDGDISISNAEDEDFVLVNNEIGSLSEPPKSTPQQSSSDDDTESEPQIGSLYDSVSLPVPSTYADSVVQSSSEDMSDDQCKGQNNHPLLIQSNTILLCDWEQEIFSRFFSDERLQSWKNVSIIPNPELERNRAKLEKQRNSKVALDDCLRSFGTPEILGEHDLWYCPRCKDHRQATKTIQIWSTGDILTIHLKRFHSARAFSDKIDIVVDFPIEGLNIGQFISNPNHDDQIYDLMAVDNHYGGLGGGHYTASVKNFRDNQWYYFNDSRVTKIENPEEVISSGAYLLFYKKRSSQDFLGGKRLSELISNGRESLEESLRKRRSNLELLSNQIKVYHNDEYIANSNSHTPLETNSVQTIENLPSNKKTRDISNDSTDTLSTTTDNIRKQRLISKENNNNKLVQIKSNGKEEYSSSPVVGANSESNIED